jgi:hypothetical protein
MNDLHDHELRNALWQASGDDCDTADAMLRVQARVRRIRRRRMDIFGVGLLVALVVTLGIASRSHDHDAPERPTSDVTVTPPPVSSAVTTPPGTELLPDTALPSGAVESGALAAPAAPAAPATGAAPATSAVEVQADAPADTAADPGQPETAAALPGSASTRPPRAQQTFTAPGGHLTVAVTNGALALVSATARTGYEAEAPTATAGSVEIEFRSRWGTSRIHVDLVDGRLEPTITDEANGRGGDDHGRRSGRTMSTTAAVADISGLRSGDGSSSGRQSRQDSSGGSALG